MKKVIIALLIFFCAVVSFAQSESAKPTFGVKLDREVAYAIIEKETHKDVIVELKSAELGDLFVEGVKIIVKDAKTGKKIYNKRFSKSYLYAFSDGTIQVGKGNALTQLTLYKSKEYNVWLMEIRKNGIY
ncbi:hypothetical protein [uncultured Parabacteroides sp.]|uniref:hypothetical protein n=1 Tax=uncultured Parabacteroides sp. TaxID=512312 RepID=UPI0025D99CF0|nr:hypothetical protein [uncultured Parabacteroides sp.]